MRGIYCRDERLNVYRSVSECLKGWPERTAPGPDKGDLIDHKRGQIDRDIVCDSAFQDYSPAGPRESHGGLKAPGAPRCLHDDVELAFPRNIACRKDGHPLPGGCVHLAGVLSGKRHWQMNQAEFSVKAIFSAFSISTC